MQEFDYHAFISHASEDKEKVARPLAEALSANGLKVWYDEFSLKIGDSLVEKIDQGLAKSAYGIVVLSHNFFDKNWPRKELNALMHLEHSGRKVILPVWVDLTHDQVAKYSPLLADRIAAKWGNKIQPVVEALIDVIKEEVGDANGVEISVSNRKTVNTNDIVLLKSDSVHGIFQLNELNITNSKIKLQIQPMSSKESANLSKIANSNDLLAISFEADAYLTKPTNVSRNLSNGIETFELSLEIQDFNKNMASMEMSFNNYSADTLAEMRAKRILLGEELKQEEDINSHMLELFVSGFNTPMTASESPFPSLYQQLGASDEFVRVSKLYAYLLLKLTGVIEHIHHLDLTLQNNKLVVDFEGQRARAYSNLDPPIIKIKGTRPL